MLTYEQFLHLDGKSQLDMTIAHGEPLAERSIENCTRLFYQITEYFVEVRVVTGSEFHIEVCPFTITNKRFLDLMSALPTTMWALLAGPGEPIPMAYMWN